MLFIEKASPSTAEIWVSESIIIIFIFSVNVKLKSTCPSAPGLTSEVNLSVDSVLSWVSTLSSTIVRLEISMIGLFSFSRSIIGLYRSVKLKTPFPLDSNKLIIPSLSISKSMLSIIPSLSKSAGQILTGISVDTNSCDVQSKIPLSL